MVSISVSKPEIFEPILLGLRSCHFTMLYCRYVLYSDTQYQLFYVKQDQKCFLGSYNQYHWLKFTHANFSILKPIHSSGFLAFTLDMLYAVTIPSFSSFRNVSLGYIILMIHFL